MPDFFTLFSTYFWLIMLVFGAFNYRKARATIAQGERAEEAERYVRRIALLANLPWAVAGVGTLLGYTPTIWYYFRPQDGNPFVIAWLAVICAVTCLYSWWILFAGGAEKVRDLNLLAALGGRYTKQSIAMIKLFAALAPLMLPVWIYLAVSMNARLPG